MKTCVSCNADKEEADFSKDSKRKDRLNGCCRKCCGVSRKVWYDQNRERVSIQKKFYEYGMSSEDFKRMRAEQGGVCAICGGLGGKRGLGVDHDHKSGKIRALLCVKCNAAIGFLDDSSALARRVTKYLEIHGL